MDSPGVGRLLRGWRNRRRRSQMDLALAVGVSTRHLSFVETGRSRPSAEMILTLAEGLDVPLRERNTLLVAGGYAPSYSETAMDDPAMAHATAAVQRILDAHDPYPGVVLNRSWDVVAANSGALGLLGDLPAEIAEPPLNLFRVSLHPDGLAARTRNFESWAGHLLWQLDRLLATNPDPQLAALAEEVHSYPNILGLSPSQEPADPRLLLDVHLDSPAGPLRLFTTLTTFGTPLDITLAELMIELFYPADAATAVALGHGRTNPILTTR